MLRGIELIMSLALAVLGITAFIAGYAKNGFLLKLIFGRERVKSTGNKWLALYLYIGAGVLLFISLLLLIP